jgi:hypothetical protein
MSDIYVNVKNMKFIDDFKFIQELSYDLLYFMSVTTNHETFYYCNYGFDSTVIIKGGNVKGEYSNKFMIMMPYDESYFNLINNDSSKG